MKINEALNNLKSTVVKNHKKITSTYSKKSKDLFVKKIKSKLTRCRSL